MDPVRETMSNEVGAWPQILLMEDEPTVAQGLQMILKQEGYGVDLAMTGQGALDALSQKGFDLLVADLRLPDIDGMEVIKQIKKDRPETEVIVITGYSTVPSAVKAIKLGAFDFLPKPFTEDEFISAVEGALREKKELSSKEHKEILEAGAQEPFMARFPEEIGEVEEPLPEILKAFEGRRDELIPMLQKVQDGIGFLPRRALQEIAHLARLPAATVFGVATFYEQFRFWPVGKHRIRVCRGTACHVKGSDRILSDLETRFGLSPGKTTEDRLFTLETVACFGSCALAPVVVVDDSVHGRMNSSKTRHILEELQE